MEDQNHCTCGETPASATHRIHGADVEPLLEVAPLRDGPGFCVYEVMPPTTFSWGNVDPNGRLTHVVSALVPIEEMPEALLVLRVHDNAIGIAGLATLVADLIAMSVEDPEMSFVWSLGLAEVRLDNTSGEAKSFMQRLRCDVGTHLRLRLHLDQGSSAVAHSVTLSIEVVTRAADDSAREGRRPCAHE